MTPRERVRQATAHRETDRVPYNLRPEASLCDRFRSETGATDFAAYFGHDIHYVSLPFPPPPAETPRHAWTPVPSEKEIAAAAGRVHALRQRGLATCSAYACGVYEQAKDWLGDEIAMILPYEDPKTFEARLDRITEWKAAVYGAYARTGVDIVWIGDDLGTQRSLVMSPSLYRQWYRPRHQHIVDRLRSIRDDVIIAFHCCGHVTPLLPDLIEMGIDILEAVQPETMDLAGLKRDFGRDLTFWGGIGTQTTLRLPDPGDVADAVRNTIALMARGGGYIAAPCHTVPPDTPWENVVAFHRAAGWDGEA